MQTENEIKITVDEDLEEGFSLELPIFSNMIVIENINSELPFKLLKIEVIK